jgi:hypothetical protein
MRVSGALMLLLVIAMAVVVVLQSRDLGAKREAVAVIATQLREEGVDATRFDRDRALEIIIVLGGLVADPEAIPNHTDDLTTIAETAAGWASGAPSPSPELHAAVAIRKAAAELRSHAVRPSPRALEAARRELDRARQALTTQAAGDGTIAPSGLVTEGVSDRLGNLEAAQKERALELEEDLGQ